MVVKSELKFIKSLQQKKFRKEHELFVVEGKKTIEEILKSGMKCYGIYTSDSDTSSLEGCSTVKISAKELQQISSLKNPNGYLGVFHMPNGKDVQVDNWVLALDGLQDPGNLGTIIRLCDWFGIATIVCSKETVDCYNPKVLQATMGSISRVQLFYTDLALFLRTTELPVYGTFMDGVSVVDHSLPEKGVLVMGNEGNGISNTIATCCDIKLTIPQFGKRTTESLNVGSATAILLQEIRR